MTTTESTPAQLDGAGLDDPIGTAERLRDEFRVGAAERDRDRAFPYQQCAAFRSSGLLGLMVPREYGGYGGDFLTLMKVVIAISAGDSNIGQMYQLHTGGTTEFHDVWIPDELCLGSPDTEGGGGGAVTSLNYQAVHTGVFVGIAKNALDDAVGFVQTRARKWYESPADRASNDLYTQLRVGEMKTAVDAAELLSLRAAELCDQAVAHPGDQRIRGEASVLTGQAREAAAEAAMFAGSTLFKVCGAGSVLAKYGFDRHWRNARTLSLHNPLDFKSMHAGDFLLNGTLPPVDSYN